MIAADDALKSAVEARDKTSEEIDGKFGDVIDLMSAFEKDFPSKSLIADPNIGETVTREAENPEMSESPLTILHALKQDLHSTVKFPSIFLSLHADES